MDMEEQRIKKDKIRKARLTRETDIERATKQYAEIVGWLYVNDKRYTNTNEWKENFIDYLQTVLGTLDTEENYISFLN